MVRREVFGTLGAHPHCGDAKGCPWRIGSGRIAFHAVWTEPATAQECSCKCLVSDTERQISGGSGQSSSSGADRCEETPSIGSKARGVSTDATRVPERDSVNASASVYDRLQLMMTERHRHQPPRDSFAKRIPGCSDRTSK